MWLSPKIFSILEVSKDSVDALRVELAALRSERDLLKSQLQTTQHTLDWLRMQWNQLQAENKALMEKAYDIRVPVPELVRTQAMARELGLDSFSLEDMGDDMARKLGFPVYDDKH